MSAIAKGILLIFQRFRFLLSNVALAENCRISALEIPLNFMVVKIHRTMYNRKDQ